MKQNQFASEDIEGSKNYFIKFGNLRIQNFTLARCAVFFAILLGSLILAHSANAEVYVHYSDNTAGAKKIDIYQKMGDSDGKDKAWVRWRLQQYAGGNTAWDVGGVTYGRVGSVALETNRDDFTFDNGTGDSGSWTNYSIGNIVAKRRDSGTGYVAYSSFASYTVGADYDEVYLGVHNNSLVNGVIRIKINGNIATGDSLDLNGLYDEGAHGSDNVNPAWIHIGSSVKQGDIITIEAAADTSKVRHVITGLQFVNQNLIV